MDCKYIFHVSVEHFELRYSDSQESLTNNFDNCPLFENATIPGARPLSPVVIELPITVEPTYYAMKSVYKNQKVLLSTHTHICNFTDMPLHASNEYPQRSSYIFPPYFIFFTESTLQHFCDTNRGVDATTPRNHP
jgi:hypothetical protein